MSTFTLPSGDDHHFKEKAFKRSFLVSFGIHILVIVAAGSMTLFRMSGTAYSPSYTVDLISLPAPAPEKAARPSPAVEKTAPTKPAPAKPVEEKPALAKPSVQKTEKAPASAPQAPPEEYIRREVVDTSGGDEAARLERRQRIEELEQEARRLYESFTDEGQAGPSAPEPAAKAGPAPTVSGAPAGGSKNAADIRFRAYYDRIWAQIRSSWVVPEGVTTQVSLVTVVGIRIATDGTIQQSWIEKKSGNDYYDQSALRAIRKASPLPPLPDELGEAPLDVGINFRFPE